MLASLLVGLVITVALAVVRSEPMPGAVDIGWSVAAGVAAAIGISCLYRGLAVGRMGVVAPVTGVLAASIPVVLGIVLEGWPSQAVVVGIGLAIVAVLLVSRVAGEADAGPSGLGLAVVSGIALGTFNVTIAQVSHGLVFGPLSIVRVVEASVVTVIIVVTRSQWRLPRSVLPWAALVGVLDTAGNAFFVLARQAGELAVAAALSSLYPVTTVVLAAVLLRERVTRQHALGIVAAAAAIVLITAGSSA